MKIPLQEVKMTMAVYSVLNLLFWIAGLTILIWQLGFVVALGVFLVVAANNIALNLIELWKK